MSKRLIWLSATSVTVWLAGAAPLRAHHSAAAIYDEGKTVTVQGMVTKVEWTNPHVFIHVDAKETTGQVVSWSFEGASPIGLYRDGVHKDSLKVGETVTVVGVPARSVEHLAEIRTITFADGRKVFDRSGKP
jgi:hypothetical protein